MLSDEEISSLAERYLRGEIGAIELSNAFATVWDWEAHISAERGKRFEVFMDIAREAGGLPVGTPRQFWKQEALQKADKDIARIEEKYREEVARRCRELVLRA